MITGIGDITRLTTAGAEPLQTQDNAATVDGDAFAAMVSELATDTVTRLEKAETASLRGLQGEGDTRAVVDAVMDAEQSLQAAIAIRDKIVSAYLEVSRMAI